MKEYRALVKHREHHKGTWCLAVPGERVYHSEGEARAAIMKAIERGAPRYIECCDVNDNFYTALYDSLEVVDSKVEAREVTAWETI